MAFLFILRKAARKVGLVDRPSARKQHKGLIPLIGGISVCLILVQYLYYKPDTLEHSDLYVVCICLLTFVGAVDDRFNICFKIRFAVQALLSIFMMYFANIKLLSLGDMFGIGQIDLGWLGYVVTVLAVVGAINAYNMIDGIDGLLGGLSIVTFASIGIVLYFGGRLSTAYFCLVICIAILPYILFNLGAFGKTRKVFMGDAGSMLIGFSVIWLLLVATQTETQPPLRPVTALWLIGVPLMDMTAVMIRRIRQGGSPFKPDRQHLHHICQRAGLNSARTLIGICTLAVIFALVGIIGEVYQVPEFVMFSSFVLCFFIYLFCLSQGRGARDEGRGLRTKD